MSPAPPLFKASLTVPKDKAADVAALLELTPPAPQAVLSAEDPFALDAIVEALYDTPPDTGFLSALTGFMVTAKALPNQDWIKHSQEGLPPVRAGRFFVYGAHDAGVVPLGIIPLRIEAGLAFGTGHHETTALCLEVLSDLAKKHRFKHVLDLGCGTGVLAIATAKLWPQRITASDIDPTAIAVTRENARANGAGPFINTIAAEGLAHPRLQENAPYNLVLANILSGPLTRMAPAVARVLAPGGMAILSGLLYWQEGLVLSFYCAQGLVLRRVVRQGSWSALVLAKPMSVVSYFPFHHRPPHAGNPWIARTSRAMTMKDEGNLRHYPHVLRTAGGRAKYK